MDNFYALDPISRLKKFEAKEGRELWKAMKRRTAAKARLIGALRCAALSKGSTSNDSDISDKSGYRTSNSHSGGYRTSDSDSHKL